MSNLFNTNANNGSWTQAQINAVWNKALIVVGRDKNVTRKDSCGAFISYSEYGKLTDNGWEIDHRYPKSLGGSDELSNLYPLHLKNNRGKGDDYPDWTCSVTSRQ